MKTLTTIPKEYIPLDYTASCRAAEIDKKLRDSIKSTRLSILAMGLGLARMKTGHLYRELGFECIAQYIHRLCDDTKMDRTSIYRWLYIGKAYLKYQYDLEQIGFTDNDGPSKLPYLEQALENHEKQEVYDKIKTMSVREFETFSKGNAESSSGARKFVTVRGHRVFVGGRLAVKINRKLDIKSYTFFRKIVRIAGKAMEDGDILLPVRLRDMSEVVRYERASRKLISRLRKNA
jgi:hypothetical protein